MSREEQLLYDAAKGVDLPGKPVEALRAGLEKRGLLRGRIGVDESGLPQPRGWEEVVGALTGATVQPAASLVSKIRLVKTRGELRLMAEAATLNEAGLRASLASIGRRSGVAAGFRTSRASGTEPGRRCRRSPPRHASRGGVTW